MAALAAQVLGIGRKNISTPGTPEKAPLLIRNNDEEVTET